MSYTPVNVDRWGGLNIAADPTEVPLNECIDGSGFDLDNQGRLCGQPDWAGIASGGTPYSRLKIINGKLYTAKGVFDSTFADTGWTAASDATDFAGAGRSQLVYVAAPGRTLKKYDAGVLSGTIINTPACELLATMPVSGRLVAGRVSSSDPALVQFSNAPTEASPLTETWGTQDYIRLAPGDDEEVKAFCAWDTYLFAFKETKFFVIQGESLGAAGTPIFNFRAVDSGGVGCCALYGATSAPQGVYFLSNTGVYLTNGDKPVCISDAIAPLFTANTGLSLGAWSLGRFDPADSGIAYYDQRLYISAVFGGQSYTLCHDIESGAWMLFDAPSVALASGPNVGVCFTYSLGVGINPFGVGHFTFNVRTDGLYKSGLSDLGDVNAKVVREAIVLGAGSLSYQTVADFTAGTYTTLTLGTETTPAEGRDRRAVQGRYLGYRLSGFISPITRITLNVRDDRASGSDA